MGVYNIMLKIIRKLNACCKLVHSVKLINTYVFNHSPLHSVISSSIFSAPVSLSFQIKLSVLKWYVKAASYLYFGISIVALLFFVAGQASTSIWLSIWSDDATSNKNGDPVLLAMRLGVYGALGMTQGLWREWEA